jgi:cyclopropane-fatty-acyl-phospholipid synthase
MPARHLSSSLTAPRLHRLDLDAMRAETRPLVDAAPWMPVGRFDHWAASRLAKVLRGAAIRIELWDGYATPCGQAPPVATIQVRDRHTLTRLLMQPALEFGEAYAEGRMTVDGDLVALLESANRALCGRPYQPNRHVPRVASADTAKSNVHVHYDLGNDFYRLWLDQSMAYTCAYFPTPDAPLESAQRAKYERICRKVELRPGDRVIEAGCGWGGLALHMARHHGVTVRAFNVSGEQLEWARRRARDEGLADRVTFIDRDYRFIDGVADVFVSVGMLEHVGPHEYRAFGAVIDRSLDREHGRGLLHFIGRHRPQPFNPWITKYIFPGAYAPTLAEVCPEVFEPQELAIVDVEDLRRHYILTLRHWLERFERHADEVGRRFDESFVRTWRLYLAGAQASFLSGDLQLFQILFTRPAHATSAWTRDEWARQRSAPPM